MEREKILICLYAYYPFENANTNVMMPLIKMLSKEYEVHILTRNVSGDAEETETFDGDIVVHRYRKNSFFRGIINLLGDIDMKVKRVWYKDFVIHIVTPIARIFQRVIKTNEYVHLKKLIHANDFVFIISTCANFESHRNVLRYKLDTQMNIPWIAYFMDPYSYYIERREEKGEFLQIEQLVYEMSDLVLTTEEIYRENKTNSLAPYLCKTHSFRYGNFKKNKHALINNIFHSGKINCVYVGSLLSEKIRSPKYFYQLINQLDDRFHFHIICNRMSEQNIFLYETTVQKKDRVTWYHNLPLEECLGIMCHADILINLGNKSVNQTPSKVFDYIGSGRPIVNIYSLTDDTSKYYLEKYPCKINIREDDNDIAENARSFTCFAEKYAGKNIEWQLIESAYCEYESETVTKRTVATIKNKLGLEGGNNVKN